MKTRQRLNRVKTLLQEQLNPLLESEGLLPMEYHRGPLKTDKSPAGSVFITGKKKVGADWAHDLYVLLRLPGAEESRLQDYGDALEEIIQRNHRIGGAFDEALLDETYYYDTRETKNPLVMIKIVAKCQMEECE